jgi:hypothetical protein
MLGIFDLPGRLSDARDEAFICCLSKAGAAHTEVTHKRALATATEATTNHPRLKLRGTI